MNRGIIFDSPELGVAAPHFIAACRYNSSELEVSSCYEQNSPEPVVRFAQASDNHQRITALSR